MIKKITNFGIVIFFSFSFARLFLDAISALAAYSTHSILVSVLLVAGFLILVLGVILKKSEFFFFIYLLFFPFYSIYQVNINISILFSGLFIFLYRSKLFNLFNTKTMNLNLPFCFVFFSILISLALSKHFFEAATVSIQYIAYFVILLSFYVEIDSLNKFKSVFYIISFMLVFALLISIIEIFFGVGSVKIFTFSHSGNIVTNSGFFRYPSIFMDAQIAAIFFSVTSILVYGFFSVFSVKNRLKIYLFILGTAGLLLTGTRIAIAGFMISIAFFVLKKKYKIISCFLFSILAFLFVLLNNFRIFGLINNLDKQRFSISGILDSFSVRVEFWKNGFVALLAHPFGVGFGASNLYDATLGSKLSGNGILGSAMGNVAQFESAFFDIACSLGFLGILGMILMIAFFFRTGFFLNSKKILFPILGFSKYLMIAMFCLCLSCLTAPLNRNDPVKFLFVIMLGSMFFLYRLYFKIKTL